MGDLFNPYHPIKKVNIFGEDDSFIDEDPELILSQDQPLSRPNLLLSIVLVASLIIFGRLFYLQIVKGSRNFLLAEGNRIRQISIPAPRGIIYDANDQPFVKNVVRYSLVIIPAELPKNDDDRRAIFEKILPITPEKERAQLDNLFNNRLDYPTINPTELLTTVNYEEAINWQIDFFDKPGLVILKEPQRQYSNLVGLGHILGFLGRADRKFLKKHPEYLLTDLIGKTGLELNYEDQLRGIRGAQQFEVNAKGQLQRTLATIVPKQGHNLRLTLDSELQNVAQRALKASQETAVKAVAIAINPKTGGVLAMVSLPDFDPNIFLKPDNEAITAIFNDMNQPLVNRAIAGQYPSGSTIKPLWAVAGLQEKVVHPNWAIDTPPEIQIGEFKFLDWKDHGLTDIKRAIAESNNIFFYAVAGGWDRMKGLGIERMVKYMQMYNFGEKTGIDLPGEASGFVPTPAWKQKTKQERWYIGDTYHLGIGQGDILVTPLQLLVAESAIFNDGKIMQPYLVERIIDTSGQIIRQIMPKTVRELPIDPQHLQTVKEGMRLTVTEGSARSLNDLLDKQNRPVEVAGKTGTAQFGSEGKTHAWFVGFAPWHDPEIGVIVLVEGGGEGHAVAAPIAKQIFQYWFSK